MRKLIIFTLVFISSHQVISCGNEYGYSLSGERIDTRYFYLTDRMLKFDIEKINEKLVKLKSKVDSGTDDYKSWSDISVNLLKLGQVDSALVILESLIELHPEEYNVNANLGTAYELNGQLEKALKYIKKGFEINPQSHSGSEWIHIKILEAKIKAGVNPIWMERNEIIKLDDLLSKVGSNSNRLMRINNNFNYQIRTRAQFTPPPNITMTNLLMTLGDFHKEVGTYEDAILAYGYALKFNESSYLKDRITNRIKELNLARDKFIGDKELPKEFLWMMKRSKLDIELLILGIDGFAEKQDSTNLVELAIKDSFEYLNNKFDSISHVLTERTEGRQNKITNNRIRNYIFLFFGIILGVSLTTVFIKKRD